MDPKAPPRDPTFGKFYSENASYVGRSLRRLGVAERHVEDLVQEVFLAVHRHWDERDPARPTRPWLFGFSFRVAAGHRRRASTVAEVPTDVEQLNEVLDPARDITKSLEAHDVHKIVHEVLACLPIEQRAVVILHDLDEVAAPEIARTLDVPLNTVYSRLRLGRQRFRSMLVERQKKTEVETPLFGALALLLSKIDARDGAASTVVRASSWLTPLAYVTAGVVVGAGGHAVVARTPPAPSTTIVSAAAVTTTATRPLVEPAPLAVDDLADAPAASASSASPVAATSAAPRGRDARRAAEERADLDVARTALVRGHPDASLAALERHTRTYGEGHFAEEREALAVQALVAVGRKSEALTRARKFVQKYPTSLFGGAIDDAVTEAISEEKSSTK